MGAALAALFYGAPDMSGFSLRARLAKGDKIFAAWITAALPRMTETIMATGFDAALFDLQHGEASFVDARESIAAARRMGYPAGVRVELEGYADAARCFDLGTEIAILPMINSVEDARKLVATLKYPPLGSRSWGPTRALGLLGLAMEDYRKTANDNVIALAMIETRPAVDALEEILNVEGLDGVFVGPSDLSISLSNGEKLDHRLPEAVAVMERVVASARERK